MKPFRTSLSARIVSAAVTLALVGSGLVAVTGAATSAALPLVLFGAVALTFVGLMLGATTHTQAVGFLAIALPLAFWPYVMAVMWITTSAPTLGWGLLAAGGVVLALNLLASIGAHETADEPAPPHAVAH